jgi:uncharacterized protein YdeI (YjbR/CyaY-like superfamily)
MRKETLMSKDRRGLKRKLNTMPDYIEKALKKNGLRQEYMARPAYQRNDYLGWIERAKKEETKQKRLNQMLEELKTGGVYMKMKHPPSVKR